MAECLYNVEFDISIDDFDSDDVLQFHNLTFKELTELFEKFAQYGEVPEITYGDQYSRVRVDQSFYINLGGFPTVSICFTIDYSDSKYTPDEIIESVNSQVIERIRQNTKIKGFM